MHQDVPGAFQRLIHYYFMNIRRPYLGLQLATCNDYKRLNRYIGRSVLQLCWVSPRALHTQHLSPDVLYLILYKEGQILISVELATLFI